MTTARALYSDLILSFTLGSNTLPNSTQATNIITNLYKTVYEIVDGVGSYAAYDASNENAVIDTEGCKAMILDIAQQKVESICNYYTSGQTGKPPSLSASEEERAKLATLKKPSFVFSSREEIYYG